MNKNKNKNTRNYSWFLDSFSHLYKRACPSVRPSVRLSRTSWISENWTEFEQNSTTTRDMNLRHIKDNSETSMRADRQNASDVWILSKI